MKRVLITGGAGFIGSECVRQAVQAGHHVTVVDNLTYAGDVRRFADVADDIHFYKADITNREFMEFVFKRRRINHVIHMAAESHVDRSILDSSPFIDTNVKGTQLLLDLARRSDVEKFINIATDEVYGELGEDGEFTEDSPLAPNSPYAVSKTSADMLGRAYYRTHGVPVVTVRPSNNYGPWQFPEKLLPVVVLKAQQIEPIPVYGQGLNVREWLHVSDCVRGILTIMEKAEAGSVYNIGSGCEQRNIDVVKSILDIVGKNHDLIQFVQDRPGHDFRYSVSFQKLHKELGYSPKVKFEQGLASTVEWYLQNMEWAETKLAYLREFWSKVYK